MTKPQLILLSAVLLLAVHSPTLADTVHLKSGSVVEGAVVKSTDDFIEIDVGLALPVTYYRDEILRIESGGAESAAPAVDDALAQSQTRTKEADAAGYEGLSLIDQGAMPEGLAKLRLAIETDPQSPVWRMNYASVLFGNGAEEYKSGRELEALGTLREVENELLKAIELFDPNTDGIMISQCYFLLGQLFYNVYDDPERAAELYTSATALYEHPRAMAMLERIQKSSSGDTLAPTAD